MSEEIKYEIDTEAYKIAREKCIGKLAGLEWMDEDDLFHILFVRTTEEPPRHGKYVRLAMMQDIDDVRMSKEVRQLINLLANREIKYICWIYSKSFDRLTHEGKIVILHHELKHIPEGFAYKGVEPHDIEDFADVVKSHPKSYYDFISEITEALDKEWIEKIYESKGGGAKNDKSN